MTRELKYNKYFFITTAFLFCCLCFVVFYFQATSKTGYPSDMRAHIGFAMNPGSNPAAGYSLLHQVTILISPALGFLKLSRVEIFSILMIVILTASIFITLMIVNNYFKNRYPGIDSYLISFMSLSLMVISMIIIPFSHRYYLGTGTPNPWHNPTYIFCKPFSILVFIYLLKAFDHQLKKISCTNELVLLSIFSLLSMWAKPSFLMSFLPSVAILLIYKFFKREISFKFLLFVGISILPSLIPFFITNNTVYHSSDTANKIIMAFGKVWGNHSKNIPLSIILAMAFPLYVFFLKVKQLSTFHLLAFINYLIAMLTFLFLAENGERMYHGNFSWGYMFAMFFLFFVSIEEFFFRKRAAPILYITGWSLFLVHLISGLFYLSNIAFGNSYF